MPSQPSPCACSNTASRQEIILFNFVQGAGLNPSARSTSLFRLSPGESGYRKLPLECSQFEEALTLAEESLSTTTECESCALIRPERAQSKLPQNQAFVRHTITLQASEFLRFRCEISMWRKNCPSRLEGISKRVSRRVIGDVPFAQHGHNIPLLLRVPVKHLVGWGSMRWDQSFSAHGCTGQTSKRHHFAAKSFRSVTQPVRIFVVLICGDVHFIEQRLVCSEVGTYLRISPTRWSMRPATYPNLKCLANAGCE